MALPRTALGDSHNFGRRVTLRGERVAKPRSLRWEWLLLSAESPLRRLLDEAAARDGLEPDAFKFLPELRFYPARGDQPREVERVVLEPLPRLSREGKQQLARVVGRSIALFSWLGVSDLHWENLVLGVDERGHTIFAPLDIEMILADLSLPTETKLLPDADPEYADICRHAAGVRRVLPFLGKPVAAPEVLAMAGAYRTTLAFLERHGKAIAAVFARLPDLEQAPIRVCLRGTDAYVHARSEPIWPPLLDAELEQLARGDIPYFFQLYGRPGIHYYGNRSLSSIKRLPLTGDVPKLDKSLSVARALSSPSRRKLREEGLFALLGAFDHPALQGRHASEELTLSFKARSLSVKVGSAELHSKRNLSGFVGSVYLPCRCGEVRTVFVPAVTRCRPVRQRG